MKISRITYLTLIVLFGAQFMNFLDRQVVAALAPALKATWHLTDTQVGLLGTAFEILYALAPVPIALLSDRWLRRKVIGLVMLFWSGAMVVTGAAQSYGMLLLGRAGLGLGEAGYGPAADTWLSDIFPPDYRSRALSVHELGVILGSAAGFVLGGVVGKALGWRPVFVIAAIPGFILAVLVWLLPEPSRGRSDYQALGIDPADARSATSPTVKGLKGLFTSPTLLVVYVVGTMLSFSSGGLVYWIPSFAIRVYGFSEDTFGWVMGGITVLAGAAGVLIGGGLADKLLKRSLAGRLLTLSASSIVGFPLVLLAIFAPNQILFALIAAVAMVLLTFYSPCIMPLIYQVTHPRQRATATAVYLLVVHSLSYAPAPAAVGWLSDQTGSLRSGIIAMAIVGLLGGVIGLWGMRFVARETRAMMDRLQGEAQG